MTITCAECGGTDFTLHITLVGTTTLRCVNHKEHLEDYDLEGLRAVHQTLHEVESKWPDEPTTDRPRAEAPATEPPRAGPAPGWCERAVMRAYGGIRRAFHRPDEGQRT